MTCIALPCALLLVAASIAVAQEPFARQAEAVPAPPLSRGLVDDPPGLARGLEWASGRFGLDQSGPLKPGFFVTSGKTVAGSGWLAAGAGYRRFVFGNRAFAEASAGQSLRLFKTLRARFEVPEITGGALSLGVQGLWQDLTQVSYFGTGPDSLDSMRSQYRVHYLDIAGYATARAGQVVSIHATAGTLRDAHISSATGPFRRDLPDTRTLFPDEPALGANAEPRFRHAGVAVVGDTRDHAGYPSRGGLYRVAWTTYWGPADGILGFRRFEAEGLQFVPLAGEWWSAAVHGLGVFTGTSDGRYVPFYMMPSLGGQALRGYHAYRFHDRNLLLAALESRVRLTPHLDGAVFFDAGNVAPAARDLNLDRRNWGFGLRLHTRSMTLARIDVARGDEGWRMLFNISDPFRLSRVTRRVPPLPFNP